MLIDATNLHFGGAVQVAISFILELDRLAAGGSDAAEPPWLSTTLVRASDAVMAELEGNLSGALHVERENRRWRSLHAWLRFTRPYAVQFTVFGPYYGWRRARRHIVGFADVTSLYPAPVGRRGGSVVSRLRARLRKLLTLRMFAHADELVAETQVVKDRIADLQPLSSTICRVVPNTYNSIFDHPELHRPAPSFRTQGAPVATFLLYVSRAYPHKNHDLLGEMGPLLNDSGDNYRFVVTLSDHEWAGLNDATRQASINVGPVEVGQLPDLYRQADAVIFPSLLECFSATPIEAMRMEKTLIASDRDFVRDLFPDVAFLFDPLRPESAVESVRAAFGDPAERSRRIENGTRLVQSMPGPRARASAYVEIVDSALGRPANRVADA